MPSTIFGLPVHPLLVHATVVFVPLAVAMVVLAVLVPRFRVWAGPLPAAHEPGRAGPDAAVDGQGENLEHQLPETRLIEKHARAWRPAAAASRSRCSSSQRPSGG